VRGPASDGTWAAGPSQRVILASAGGTMHPGLRVVAVAFKEDDWHEPSDEFAEVVANPTSGTFTFWRKGACVESLGCTISRWEASRAGIRVSGAEKNLYAEARSRILAELPRLRAASPACPTDAILAAARVYSLARVSGDEEKGALKEFDKLVTGLSTTHCPATPSGHAKPLSVLRRDLVASVKKLLSGRGAGRR
jgi:hypothetical protein